MMKPRDTALSQDLLLEHAVWLRRLARELVRDPGAADDLVQDTWLAALRSRPDLGLPLRPWLARVMRNGATQRLRRTAGRSAREQAAARPEAVPSARELVERAEQQRLLVNEVLALPEPYRETLLLRFYEGLAPAQIAEALGVPAATVRTHLHRGLSKLRERMDREHGGDRKAWVLMLQPLLSESVTPIMPVVAGSLAMALAVVLVGVLGWSWMTRLEQNRPADLVPSEATVQGFASDATDLGGSRNRRVAFVGKSGEEARTRRLRMVHAGSGVALPSYAVQVLGELFSSDVDGWVSVPLAAKELLPVDHAGLAEWVGSGHASSRLDSIERDAIALPAGVDPMDLAVPAGPSFPLRIQSPVGFEVSDLQATLQSEPIDGGGTGWPVAPVRSGGPSDPGPWVRFAQPAALSASSSGGLRLILRHTSGLLMGAALIDQGIDSQTGTVPVLLEQMALIEGHIETASDLSGVMVFVKRVVDGEQVTESRGSWTAPDGSGAYALKYLEPGIYDMQVSGPLHDDWSSQFTLAPGQRRVQDVPLVGHASAGSLSGVVRSDSGTYGGQLLVFLLDQDGGLVGVFPTDWEAHAEFGSQARFAFESAPYGPLRLHVVSLTDEVGFRCQPHALVAPNGEVLVTLLDRETVCDWQFQVFTEQQGTPLPKFVIKMNLEGGFERTFAAQLKPEPGPGKSGWTWTRIVAGLRWNEFEGPAPLKGLARDARFTWSVHAEGYTPVSGDQDDFDNKATGERSIVVRMGLLPTGNRKSE